MGTAPDLGPDGFDFTYGAGRVDAANAINFSPFSPFTALAVNATRFSAGQTLVLGLAAANPPGNPTLDLYVGALAPDGNTVVFLSAAGGIGGVGTLGTPASVAPLTATPAGFSFSQSDFSQFTFPAGLPAGTYTLFAALFRNRSLADNVMDNGDLIGLSAIPIVYSP